MPSHIDLKSCAGYFLSVSLIKIIPAFAATALFLAVVPGQGMAMILRQCLVGGRRAVLLRIWQCNRVTNLGNTLFRWPMAIFAKSHTAFPVLKYAGYLKLWNAK